MTIFAASETIEIEPVAGWRGQAVQSEQMTLVSYVTTADAPDVHEHQHPEEEAWMVIEDGSQSGSTATSASCSPGTLLVIASNVRHRVRALRASRALVVDSPPRRQLPGTAH
jgi:quercetin dioxygenase-like cupin family protein